MKVVIIKGQKCISDALGFDLEKFAENLAPISKNLAMGQYENRGELAKDIQERLSDAEILFLAIESVEDSTESMMQQMMEENPIMKMLKELGLNN